MLLATISGTPFQLDAPAAASWERTIAAGNPGGIKTAYRDWAYQQRLYNGWLARLPGYNFALPPNESKHVDGTAVDALLPSTAWLIAHPEHGWRRTNTAESWHWEYFPELDQHAQDADTPVAIPLKPATKGFTPMFITRYKPWGEWYFNIVPQVSITNMTNEDGNLLARIAGIGHSVISDSAELAVVLNAVGFSGRFGVPGAEFVDAEALVHSLAGGETLYVTKR